jgi:hypothetical protein
MIFSPIINAINKQLKLVPNAPQLAEENKGFKPTLRTKWMRSTLLPAEPTQITLGQDRMLRYNGVCQVDVFVPATTGSDDALIDAIVAHFNAFERRFLQEAGEQVNIKLAWRGVGTTETDWYRVPVFIRYEMFTQ